jgi:uncharacterized protein with ParB-like and HNH nuclease domain
MLYLIGGTSRSGKTLLAKRLLQEHKLAYLSLDWLMMGFNDGIPEYGIHHKLWPNEIAKKMWPFLEAILSSLLLEDIDYVIEGEAMLPELLTVFIKKHPKKVRVVFVGYADIKVTDKVDQVKQFTSAEFDWLIELSDQYITDHIGNMVQYSKTIQNSCKQYNLAYFDTSADFLSGIEKAKQHLLA